MDRRLRLGFVYLWDEKWLGGVYYAQNLLNALNTLEYNKKPLVIIFCLNDKAYEDLKENTGYPFLKKSIVKYRLRKRIIRKIISLYNPVKSFDIDLFGLNCNEDVIFPWAHGTKGKNSVFWVPDFQSKYLTDLFDKREIMDRDMAIMACCKRGTPIVFSSYDAQKDFYKFYPNYIKHPTFVLHFATCQPNFENLDIEMLKSKFGIHDRYLFCPNQFWKHKNHLFLFKAYKKAHDSGLKMQLVCTGRMSDYRNSAYIEQLKDFIISNRLENFILTLGMIDKKELLCLMKNSYAVVQPSLFEGWNTTVEDCKAMSKFVFLSNLDVHYEQLNKNVCFFDPHNEDDLVNKLLTVKPKEEYYDYSNNVKNFGREFYSILISVSKSKDSL